MGGNISALPQLNPDFPYFCLTFRQWDKIKLVQANQQIISQILSAISHVWPNGIANHKWENGAYEIKFHGTPFSMNSSKGEALASKRMACHLLSSLVSLGYDLVVSTDLGRTTDLTSWFFQHNTAATGHYLTPPHIMCLSLSRSDKLQLVNAPEHFRQILTDALKSYAYGIQDTEVVEFDFEVKLSGYPWHTASFEEGIHARRALLDIIRRFDANRYRLLTTANLKGTADCLFFKEEPNLPAGETRYMMLSLNASDRIRMIDANHDIINTVRACISQSWNQGLQDQKDFTADLGCYEFKLNGYPWNCSGWDAVSARLLITVLMQNLLAKGWAVLSGLDISRRINDKAVFVLRSCPPTNLPHFCLSPSDVDKIRLINAPAEIIQVAVQVVRINWPLGIAREGANCGAYEWKLNGQPWSPFSGNDYIVARHLMAVLLNEFSLRGWRVICSADVSAKFVHQQNGPDYPIDVHSWFLAKTGVSGVASAPGNMDVSLSGVDIRSQFGYDSNPSAPREDASGVPQIPGGLYTPGPVGYGVNGASPFEMPPPSYEEVAKVVPKG